MVNIKPKSYPFCSAKSVELKYADGQCYYRIKHKRNCYLSMFRSYPLVEDFLTNDQDYKNAIKYVNSWNRRAK